MVGQISGRTLRNKEEEWVHTRIQEGGRFRPDGQKNSLEVVFLSPQIILQFTEGRSIYLSIFAGSLKFEHYTRECEFENFYKILKMSPEKQDRHSLAHAHSTSNAMVLLPLIHRGPTFSRGSNFFQGGGGPNANFYKKKPI